MPVVSGTVKRPGACPQHQLRFGPACRGGPGRGADYRLNRLLTAYQRPPAHKSQTAKSRQPLRTFIGNLYPPHCPPFCSKHSHRPPSGPNRRSLSLAMWLPLSSIIATRNRETYRRSGPRWQPQSSRESRRPTMDCSGYRWVSWHSCSAAKEASSFVKAAGSTGLTK
jgi:hypothetical protein